MSLEIIGRSLIGLGLLLVLVGLAFVLLPRVPFLGRLPGDISIQRGGFSLYLPLATSLLVSLLLTLLLNLLLHLFHK